MEEKKLDHYWQSKVDKYYMNSRKSSQVDNKIISALRRSMKTSDKDTTSIDDIIEKRRKLIMAQQAMTTPSSNKSRILASFVPDEVIYNPNDYRPRKYIVALMFADVSGFTQLCENYATKIEDGTSAMTQILNSYIGAMVQEIVTHEGDLLKFSGDAFLAMWKATSKMTIMQAVHTAIDCGLIIQRDYGTMETDVGIVLKVKIAISAGNVTFNLIGNNVNSHWITVGPAVWDVKYAEMISKAGEVIVTSDAWKYVNTSQYIASKRNDNHIRITGLSNRWRNFIVHADANAEIKFTHNRSLPTMGNRDFYLQSIDTVIQMYTDTTMKSYRPSISYAISCGEVVSSALSKYISLIVLNVVDSDEKLENLTEMRYVIILFLNIVTAMKKDEILINIAEQAYNIVETTLNQYQGFLDKLSMFDKDLVCLAVFGFRGYKHELNVQQALMCATVLKKELSQIKYVDTVSIGVTAGFVYCGIIGHIMRREATVMGLCVNKGARLMMAYPEKITCDKEVFLQSQLPSGHFVQMPHRELKGFSNVGPIYEYLENFKHETTISTALIGRDHEQRMFETWLKNIIRDEGNVEKKNLLIIEGQLRVGKTRFVEEIIQYFPHSYPITKISMDNTAPQSYTVIKVLLRTVIQDMYPEEDVDNKIKSILNDSVPEEYWFLFHNIFGIHIESEPSGLSRENISTSFFNNLFIQMCRLIFTKMQFLIFDKGGLIDMDSLHLLSVMLDHLPVAALLVVHTPKLLRNELLMAETKKLRTQVIHMEGVDRWHHATIICQLMNVDAISSELEKIVQISSEGYVSWIEKFIRIMIHSKQLSIIEMTKKQALSMGAIISMNNKNKLERDDNDKRFTIEYTNESNQWLSGWEVFRTSFRRTDVNARRSNILENVKVAVLNPTYSFEDMQIEATSYVIFLKTYDNLAGFEKQILKCSSAMGEIFHTSLLLQTLRAEKEEHIIKGIIKLFELGIFEFTDLEYFNFKTEFNNRRSDESSSSRRTNRSILRNVYIRFRDPMFFKYAYNLLTEHQKKHYHNIAISILRSSIKKCDICGGGSFNTLLGVRRRNIFRDKDEELSVLNKYFRDGGFAFKYFNQDVEYNRIQISVDSTHSSKRSARVINPSKSNNAILDLKYLSGCECQTLLSGMYTQIIRHCKKSEKVQTLIEAYIEFVDLKINMNDINEAIVLINEADEFVRGPKFKLADNSQRMLSWQKNFVLGRISSKKGKIMYEFGNLPETERYLFEAMAFYEHPFPRNRHIFEIKYFYEKYKLKQLLKTNVCMYTKEIAGVEDMVYNYVAETLHYLYDYFMTIGKYKEAHLAAIWSFNTTLKANTEFDLICTASANMISLGRQLVQWELCSQIEDLSMLMCIRKIDNLDVTDIYYYIELVTSILLFRLTKSDTVTAIKIGQKFISILSIVKADYKLIFAMATLGEMLTAKKMFRPLLAFYRELKLMHNVQGLCCKTFYYAGVVDIYLDTGYWIESYSTCYKFYIDNKDEILCNKHVDPGWYLVMTLSCYCVRTRRWDMIAEWKSAFVKFMSGHYAICKYPMTLMRFAETQLTYLVTQIQNKHPKRCNHIRDNITRIFHVLDQLVLHNKSYKVGFYVLKGYYSHINGNNEEMLYHMQTGLALAKELQFTLLVDEYNFFIETLNQYHNMNKLYFWSGMSRTEELKHVNANLRPYDTFSTIISES